VIRGGSSGDYPEVLRASYRGDDLPPSFRADFIGFRCARDVSP
jgi:formylglycine-generating enzyme required for sulfatase activity